jgi:ferrochelatase
VCRPISTTPPISKPWPPASKPAQDLDWRPDLIITSFHGLPQAFIDKGDPYQTQCERTVQLLREALSLKPADMRLTWQSRSGRKPWLQPDTEETLAELARSGLKNISVITPGFAADCVETLEEIAIRAAQTFRKNGGKNLTTIPCLNANTPSSAMLHTLASNELSGW